MLCCLGEVTLPLERLSKNPKGCNCTGEAAGASKDFHKFFLCDRLARDVVQKTMQAQPYRLSMISRRHMHCCKCAWRRSATTSD